MQDDVHKVEEGWFGGGRQVHAVQQQYGHSGRPALPATGERKRGLHGVSRKANMASS
jgi:hypothetical protein